MRRSAVVRGASTAQVAVYDALLFLMVTVLVSTGMFLYSAKLTSDGPGLTSEAYTDLAEAQLNATLLQDAPEGLSVTRTGPEGTENVSSLRAIYPSGSSRPDVEWALAAYCNLTLDGRRNGTDWGLSKVEGLIRNATILTALNGTEYAWALMMNDEMLIDGSSINDLSVPEGLPGSRWASSAQVWTENVKEGDVAQVFNGTMWYYLWPA
jgi:hypothetical protein